MGVLGELYELWTPTLDRDRLFSLVPVHLQSAAGQLAGVVKRVEDFPSEKQDKVALYTIGLWLLILAEDGAVPLRPQEVGLIGRIMKRQTKHELWSVVYSEGEKLSKFAHRCAIPRARPYMRDLNSSEIIKAYEAEQRERAIREEEEDNLLFGKYENNADD
jgi:hypothetical protein